MIPKPIYTPENLNAPAYQLRYSWTGWPLNTHLFPSFSDDIVRQLDQTWETDQLRRLQHEWTGHQAHFSFSTTPGVSPVFLASRVKGRLQHVLRTAGLPNHFAHNFSVRAVGTPTREQVEHYVLHQVQNESFADPRFKELLHEFTFSNPNLDLSRPSETGRGRYWYNLHLVLVVEQRWRIGERAMLRRLHEFSLKIAEKKGYGISTLSLMPDHMHIALRGNVAHSPLDIALAFLNNLAYAVGQNAIWQPGFYAGTFGEYNMGAVRIGPRQSQRNSQEVTGS